MVLISFLKVIGSEDSIYRIIEFEFRVVIILYFLGKNLVGRIMWDFECYVFKGYRVVLCVEGLSKFGGEKFGIIL